VITIWRRSTSTLRCRGTTLHDTWRFPSALPSPAVLAGMG
jgi:hypothetical protein